MWYRHLLLLELIVIVSVWSLCDPNTRYRTADGTCNSLQREQLGSSERFFSRYLEAEYEDDIAVPRVGPNPRTVSNRVMATGTTKKNLHQVNILETIYAQFKNHDLERNLLLQGSTPETTVQIPLLPGDALYNASASNNYILVSLSNGTVSSGTGQFEVYNGATSWSDLSQIYGPTPEIASALRLFSDGKLKTSNYVIQLNPFVSIPFFNLLPSQAITNLTSNTVLLGGPSNTPTAGDDRASENIGLFIINVLYFREHNRIATALKAARVFRQADGTDINITTISDPVQLDELLFQEAKRRLIAQDQKIFFKDYVSVVLRSPLKKYNGYKESRGSETPIEFSTGAFRYGHSSIGSYKLRNSTTNCIYTYTIPAGTFGPFPVVSSELPFAGQLGGFFSPQFALFTAGGLENVLAGMLSEKAELADALFADPVRTIRFAGSIGAGIDLATFDIVRGRLNGLANYHNLRKRFYGKDDEVASQKNIYALPGCQGNKNAAIDPIECFLYITSNLSAASTLRELYGKVNRLDGLVGLLSEDLEDDQLLPRTLRGIIAEWYTDLRDSDRFYYENGQFSPEELLEIEARTLSDIIRDNTSLKNIQDSAFQVQSPSSAGARC